MFKLIWTQLQLLEFVIICLIKGVLVWETINLDPLICKRATEKPVQTYYLPDMNINLKVTFFVTFQFWTHT